MTPGQKVFVEIYSSALRACKWVPGIFEGYVSAIDRDKRVSVTLENGVFIREAAPECVKESEPSQLAIF